MNLQKSIHSNQLIRQLFNKLFPVKVFSIVLVAINCFIDSLLASRFLGTEALAAIGLFSPLCTIIYMTGILITGIQVLCAGHMGRGEPKKIVSLFSTCVVFLSVLSLIFTLIFLAFSTNLAAILGAKGNSQILLSEYILGYSFGIIGQVLSSLLLAFLPLNNNAKYSYLHIGIMAFTNIILDIVLTQAVPLGIFGLGLATSISYLLPTAIIFITFLNKKKIVHFHFGNFCFRDLPKAAKIGLPSMLFNVGCTIKSFALNNLLLSSGGIAAVAALSVQGNICSILGAIPCGAAETVLVLGSIYYGEEDRKSMEKLLNYSIRITSLISIAATICLMGCSSIIPSMYYAHGTDAFEITRQMLLLFPSFLVFNSIFNIFMKMYQCQERVGFVNFMSFFECVLIAIVAAIGVPFLGTNAVWLAFPAAEILCILIIGLMVFIKNKKISLLSSDWLMMKSDFGVSDEDHMDLSLRSMEEVIEISEKVISFCTSKGIDKKRSMIAGLSIEEMAGNTIIHGFKDQKNHIIDLRVIYKDHHIILRMRDDCNEFDPVNYIEQFQATDVTDNLGINMINKLASEMMYMNNMGINVLLIKI